MAPVFGHGRLRLYLLKLLEEAPRHGYEVIRLLEERFQGLYAPSAGTVYPRLAKLEAEGLVTHATEGGRKVYSITDAGRAELAGRRGELADLEREIHESVSGLAAEIREDVRGSARHLREEMRAAAAQQARENGGEDWRQAKREMKEQARRAKEDSRQAKEEARRARQAEARARDQALRIKQRVQEQMQEHLRRGDWPAGVIEGIAELTRELAALADPERHARKADRSAGRPASAAEPPAPAWARQEHSPGGDPVRELERLLDHFRDDIRDAARDNGVTQEQLREARRRLSETAAHLGVLLRPGGGKGA